MELIRQVGNEPPLVGLMRVYKDYYPDVIVGDVVSGRASVFTVIMYLHICESLLKVIASKSRMARKAWRDSTVEFGQNAQWSPATELQRGKEEQHSQTKNEVIIIA